ncbi:MAG: hypothetical protein OHK0039_32780 [Bacteroidia bacterium]
MPPIHACRRISDPAHQTLPVGRVCWLLGLVWLLSGCSRPWLPLHVETTFASASLSWSPVQGHPARLCTVRYRVLGDTAWQTGLPLWFDRRSWAYRGSLVELAPGTAYEAEVALGDGSTRRRATFETWRDDLPIADTVYVRGGTRPLRLTRSGSPAGYVLYCPAPGDTGIIDVQNRYLFCVNIKADYVILRGLDLRGAVEHGVYIGRQHHVVIEDCDISGWGRPLTTGSTYGATYQAGIMGEGNTDLPRQVVIQRNRIHHPRYGCQPRHPDARWPGGPVAISLQQGGGSYVIRHNEIYSDAAHAFADGMGEWRNYTFYGFPSRNSDIYGNRISDCIDDGIEAEGGNENIRIWDNETARCGTHIATANTNLGPVYLWRNRAAAGGKVWGKFYDRHRPDELGQAPRGRIFLFYNTLLPGGPQRAFGGAHILSRHNDWRGAAADTIIRLYGDDNDLRHDRLRGAVGGRQTDLTQPDVYGAGLPARPQ